MSLVEIVVQFSAFQLIPLVSKRCLPSQPFSSTPSHNQIDLHLLKSLGCVYDLLNLAVTEEHVLDEQIRGISSRIRIPLHSKLSDILRLTCYKSPVVVETKCL